MGHLASDYIYITTSALCQGEIANLTPEENWNPSRKCGSRVVILECEELHEWGKRIFCGFEYCDRCGKDGSPLHKRRSMRMMGKIFYLGMSRQQRRGLGYFVFTIPIEVRKKCKNKKILGRLGKGMVRILKDHGFNEGIRRWHFFGDGSVVEGKLNLGQYHPHLNALVSAKWLDKKELKGIREEWKHLLERETGIRIEKESVVNYSYYKHEGQWSHKAKYVTRATFKALEGWKNLAKELHGFRNICYWGWGQKEERLRKEQIGFKRFQEWIEEVLLKRGEGESKEMENEAILSRMECPECWSEGKFRSYLRRIRIVDYEKIAWRVMEEYGNGFLRLERLPVNLIVKPIFEGRGKGGKGFSLPP